MKKRLPLVFLTLFLAMPMALWAMQETPPAPRLEITGPPNATNLPIVSIPLAVYDTLGQPVSDLETENFTLSGELADRASLANAQSITDDNLDFATVLMIDTSSSMAGPPIEQAKAAAKAFVNAVRPDDSVAIMGFSTNVYLVQDFTIDRDLLLNAIDSLVVGGKTALYDAGLEAVKKATESTLSRRAVILLSDGAEYGGVSSSARDAALKEAHIRGVPLYTIGLGYGFDRTYLKELSDGTNARNYESPTPDDLVSIYNDLASLLRSQYILTLNVDVPKDGTEYTLVVKATTSEGDTNEASVILRAPIPVPLVTLPALPEGAISEVTQVTATVAADDDISSVAFTLDGTSVEADGFTTTIDPMTLQPGSHQLALTVTDVNGDSGSDTLDFEVAALPPQVTLVSPLGEEEITTPQTVTLDVTSQTPVVSATYSLDGSVVSTSETAPYEFNVDPFTLTPGEHTLSVEVLNQGGLTTTVDQTFTVGAIPPIVAVSGLQNGQTISEPTDVVIDTLSQGQTPVSRVTIQVGVLPNLNSVEAPLTDNVVTYTLDPMLLTPGENLLSITATLESGPQTTLDVPFVVAALPPVVTVVGLDTGEELSENRAVLLDVQSQTPVSSVVYSIDGAKAGSPASAPYGFDLDVLQIGPGDHTLSVEVNNAGGQSTVIDVPFSIPEGPSLTATASVATSTPKPTDTRVPSSATPVPSNATPIPTSATPVAPSATPMPPSATPIPPSPTATEDTTMTAQAQAALRAEATTNAQGTRDAEGTLDAFVQATLDSQSTLDAEASASAQAVTEEPTQATEEPTQATEEATEEVTATTVAQQPTAETPARTPTIGASFTPIPITEVVAQTTPEEANIPQTLLLVGAIVLVILLVLYFVLRGRGRS